MDGAGQLLTLRLSHNGNYDYAVSNMIYKILIFTMGYSNSDHAFKNSPAAGEVNLVSIDITRIPNKIDRFFFAQHLFTLI